MNTASNIYLSASTFVLVLATLFGCNREEQEPQNGFSFSSSFSEVDYSTYSATPFVSVEDSIILDKLERMKEVQNIGENFVSRLEASGKIEISDGSQISLIELSKNECPQERFAACNQTNSEDLGTKSSVLLTSFAEMEESVKSQGERGTCVAHAMASAAELLGRRAGYDLQLSEQHLYFEAKKATDTWNDSGLVPSHTFSQLTNSSTPIASESAWPYNPSHENCQSYLEAHPDAACSRTEAQGVGELFTDPDPKTAEGDRYVIDKAHQLYASVGRIKQALHFGFPVVLSVNINKDFELADMNCNSKIKAKVLSSHCKQGYASWVFKFSGCEGICGHAMLAFGYADDPEVEGGGVVFIKNSWGSSWSDNGIVTVSYKWLENSLLDAQAIVSVSLLSE